MMLGVFYDNLSAERKNSGLEPNFELIRTVGQTALEVVRSACPATNCKYCRLLEQLRFLWRMEEFLLSYLLRYTLGGLLRFPLAFDLHRKIPPHTC